MRTKNLSRKEFKQIKVLIKLGLKKRKIADLVGKSIGTVLRVAPLKDWSAFEAFKANYAKEVRARQEGKFDESSLDESDLKVSDNMDLVKAEFSKILQSITVIEHLLK